MTPATRETADHAELARLAAKLRETKYRWTMGYRDDVLLNPDGPEAADALEALLAENAALRNACAKSNDETSQTLGKALGYPWFKDDQINFPGATDKNGVCVGDHVAEMVSFTRHVPSAPNQAKEAGE